LEGKEREDQIKLMQRISEPIARNMIYEDWWFEQIAASYLFGNMESWMIRIKKYGLMHFFQFFKWLIFPFNLKCYLALLRKEIKRI
jgi:poly-gamma-glutamate synthesis protein (capsule biosynthesis protein)